MADHAPIALQRRYFETGVTRPVSWRRCQLEVLFAALERHESSLLAALHEDLGKPPLEAWVSEIGFLRMEIRHTLRRLKAWAKPRRVGAPAMLWPASARIVPEPRGVALVIAPWNYPLQLALAPAIAALAAGNTVVLKPSELAPQTARAIERMLVDSFPADIVSVVQGNHETVQDLIARRPDFIFYTGGPRGGAAVHSAAAAHLIPTVLELGGKSPCIVCADAPLEITARRITWGKFLNAGQTCVAPDHLWVHRSIAPKLIQEIRNSIRQFYGDDPRKSPDYGRISHAGHLQRLSSMLDDAEILHGGKIIQDERYVEPSILSAPRRGSMLDTEEIFGPLLPIREFEDLQEVISHQRTQAIPLALYVFTRDRATQDRLVGSIRSGGVCVNDILSHILAPELPFGGLGASGLGAYHGKTGFDAFSHSRSVMRRSFVGENSFRYPPSPIPLDRLKRLLRFFGA